LVLWVNNHDGVLVRVLSWRAFRYFATFGYGLYLVHVPVVYSVCVPVALAAQQRWHPAWPVLWVSMIVCALFISAAGGYLIHILIEKPALILRDLVSP
jgi:peptidoglycan/LPS O-acetylase OafA/YrhL